MTMPGDPPKQLAGAHSTRNVPLDVLRAVGVILVYGAHITTPPPGNWTGALARWWGKNGAIGVDIFFVLSGYLISGLILDEFAARGRVNVKRFLIRRAFKLYPAYYAFIAYLILMPTAKALASGNSGSVFISQLRHMVPNLFFYQNYVYDWAYTPMHTWSLAVEEHFYLVIPFVLVFLLRRNRLIWLFAVAFAGQLVAGWFAAHGANPYATHVQFTELFAGVCLRCSWYLWPAFRSACGRFAWPLTIAGAAFLVAPLPARNIMVEAGSILLVAGAVHLDRARFHQRLRPMTFVPKVLAWVGMYSYSIYLWHVTTGRIADKVTLRFIGIAGWWPCMLASMTGAILAGIALSVLIEFPMLAVRDRLWPRTTPPPSPVNVPSP